MIYLDDGTKKARCYKGRRKLYAFCYSGGVFLNLLVDVECASNINTITMLEEISFKLFTETNTRFIDGELEEPVCEEGELEWDTDDLRDYELRKKTPQLDGQSYNNPDGRLSISIEVDYTMVDYRGNFTIIDHEDNFIIISLPPATTHTRPQCHGDEMLSGRGEEDSRLSGRGEEDPRHRVWIDRNAANHSTERNTETVLRITRTRVRSVYKEIKKENESVRPVPKPRRHRKVEGKTSETNTVEDTKADGSESEFGDMYETVEIGPVSQDRIGDREVKRKMNRVLMRIQK
ncbi:hypothetical protein ScPMuIL_004614 [Solemya velum]